MITVEEARNLTEESNKNPFNVVRNEVERIGGLIHKASQQGFSIIYVKINDVQYPNTVMNRIEGYGYKVNLVNHEGIMKFRVSWE